MGWCAGTDEAVEEECRVTPVNTRSRERSLRWPHNQSCKSAAAGIGSQEDRGDA